MKLPVFITLLVLHFWPAFAQHGNHIISQMPAVKKVDTAQISRLLQQSKSFTAKDQPKSLRLAWRALELAKNSNSDDFLAQCYSQLASLHRNSRNPQLYQFDSLAVAHSSLSGNAVLHFNTLQLYATDLLNDGRTKLASNYIEFANAIADSLQEKPLLYQIAFVKGFYGYKTFKMQDARKHFETCLALAYELRNNKSVADSKLWIATANLYTGKRDSVTQLLFDAINAYKHSQSYDGLGRAYGMLAFAYQAYGNLPQSIMHYQLSADYYLKAKHPIDQAYAYLSMSPLYTRLKEYDTAKIYLQQGEAILLRLKSAPGLALVNNYWGQLYSAMGETEKAAAFFKKATEQNKAVNSALLGVANNGYSALNMVRAGKQKEADSLLNIGVQQMRKIAPKELLATAAKRLKENHPGMDSTGFAEVANFISGKDMQPVRFDSSAAALNPYTAADAASDSSIHALFNRQLLEQETKYKTKELYDSVRLQQQALLISKQQVAQRNISLLAAIVVLVLLCILGWQQLVRRKQAEAARKLAEADQITIANLLEALKHSTGNYLKKFSSFVSFSKAKHGNAKGLQEVEERLNAVMALQHILSKNSMDTSVNMDDYLLSICSNLLQVFDTGQMISLAIQAPVQMDSRTALVIGQLVNELVTNSFKYAFNGRSTGEIRVGLRPGSGGLFLLNVSDNGNGLPLHVNRSTGMDLIEGFCNQLNGSFSFTRNNGTVFSMQFAAPLQTTTAHAEA